MGGSYEVYELLKDKVVWHDLERDNSDKPNDKNQIVIIEAFCFNGMARYDKDYYGWKAVEKGYRPAGVKRWAIVPNEIWLAYHHGYFDRFDSQRNFQTKEEFMGCANKSKHVLYKEVPENAERIGHFFEDRPYSSYSASIYYKDGQYYLCDGCKEWALD